MNPRVVFVSRPKRAVLFGFINRSLRWSNKFFKRFSVIEIYERERFVWQHECGAAIDHVVNEHLPVAQAIAKLLGFICGFESEVMISQPRTNAGMMAQFVKKFRDVETHADVEERFVEVSIELKDLTSRPV